jgi:hypothetical protein
MTPAKDIPEPTDPPPGLPGISSSWRPPTQDSPQSPPMPDGQRCTCDRCPHCGKPR